MKFIKYIVFAVLAVAFIVLQWFTRFLIPWRFIRAAGLVIGGILAFLLISYLISWLLDAPNRRAQAAERARFGTPATVVASTETVNDVYFEDLGRPAETR